MTTPTVVLVHGFWGDAAHWSKVIVELDHRGYTGTRAVELTLNSLAEDAERVQQVVKQIDGPVLLVGHSYGGAVITEAGDLPNVAGLVYIAAFAPEAGESLGQLNEQAPPAAGANLAPDANGFVRIAPDKFRESFAQDLAEDEALVMAVTQQAPPGAAFGGTVTDPAWAKKPTWYQVSSEDRMIDPDSERAMAARMNPRKTIELATGHASLASQPQAVTDLIDEAAKSVS